jgi:hypothetical protein
MASPAPDPQAAPATQTSPPTGAAPEPPRPSANEIARSAGVVVAGPLLLDLWEVLAPLSLVRRWPGRFASASIRRTGWWLTLGGVAALIADHGVVRPALRRWGATPQERTRRLPGDPEDPSLFVTTRAVTVAAPAEEVWRWLVQIGADRGGFYSYDWLENLAGCDLESADQVRSEWQERTPGDLLYMTPAMATRIADVDPPRALVIENWGAYVIEPIDGRSCRLLARSRASRDLGGLAYVLLIELPHAIMERKMLLGLKERAERG